MLANPLVEVPGSKVVWPCARKHPNKTDESNKRIPNPDRCLTMYKMHCSGPFREEKAFSRALIIVKLGFVQNYRLRINSDVEMEGSLVRNQSILKYREEHFAALRRNVWRR